LNFPRARTIDLRARVQERDVRVARLVDLEQEGLLDTRGSLPDFKTAYFFEWPGDFSRGQGSFLIGFEGFLGAAPLEK
jgi:hypothetical protein